MSPSKASQFAENLIKLLGEYHSDDMAFLASLIGRNDALGMRKYGFFLFL